MHNTGDLRLLSMFQFTLKIVLISLLDRSSRALYLRYRKNNNEKLCDWPLPFIVDVIYLNCLNTFPLDYLLIFYFEFTSKELIQLKRVDVRKKTASYDVSRRSCMK